MDWPAHRRESRTWTPRHRQGSKADRTLDRTEVSIPSRNGQFYEPAGGVARTHKAAIIAVARLEAGIRRSPRSVRGLPAVQRVRRIVQDRTHRRRLARLRMCAGAKTDEAAKSQLAGVKALAAMLDAAGTGPITLDTPLGARTAC